MLKSCESCSASIKHIDTTSIKSNLGLGLVDSVGCIPFPPCQLIWADDSWPCRTCKSWSHFRFPGNIWPWFFECYLYSTSNQINWINSRYMTCMCIATDGLQILSKFRSHKVSHHVTLKRNNLKSRSQSDSKVVEANCNIGFHPWWPGKPLGSGDSYDSAVTENPHTFQRTDINHLGKRKSILKNALWWDMLFPRRVPHQSLMTLKSIFTMKGQTLPVRFGNQYLNTCQI